jgi:hypothetical protein
MKPARNAAGAVCGAILWLAAPAAAQSGQRLADKDVKAIIEDVDHARDRFEDQLDGKIKDAILRGPRGEVSVKDYLDDLQENVKKLKERFSNTYSASSEAAVVLRQGSDIHNYIKAQPREIKGGSEWDRMALDLGRLAEAYGTTFPLPSGAAVRRINDHEVASAADAVAKQADRIKSAVGHDSAVPKPQREAVRHDLDTLKKQAGVVKSRAADSKPGSAEARQLLDTVDKLRGFFESTQLQPATTTEWNALRDPLEKLTQAYRLAPPPQ